MVLDFNKGLFPRRIIDELREITSGQTIGLEAGSNAVGDVNNTDYKRNMVLDASISASIVAGAGSNITLGSNPANQWDGDNSTQTQYNTGGARVDDNDYWEVKYDFGSSQSFKRLSGYANIAAPSNGDIRFRLQYSVNGSSWTDVTDDIITQTNNTDVFWLENTLTFRYIRFYCIRNPVTGTASWEEVLKIYELRVNL